MGQLWIPTFFFVIPWKSKTINTWHFPWTKGKIHRGTCSKMVDLDFQEMVDSTIYFIEIIEAYQVSLWLQFFKRDVIESFWYKGSEENTVKFNWKRGHCSGCAEASEQWLGFFQSAAGCDSDPRKKRSLTCRPKTNIFHKKMDGFVQVIFRLKWSLLRWHVTIYFFVWGGGGGKSKIVWIVRKMLDCLPSQGLVTTSMTLHF